MKKYLLIVSLALMAVLMAACSSAATPTAAPAVDEAPATEEATAVTIPTSTPEPTTETAVEAKTGGTLVVGIPAVKTFDPIFVADDSSFYVVSNIFSNLFRVVDGEVVPDLATSWEQPDDTTVIFHLREGAMWQDGNDVFPAGESREVTADDVVYSINRAVTTDGAATPADFMGTFASVEALDTYTVQLKLSAPDVMLFTNARGLSFIPVVPQEAVEFYGDQFGMNPIGSGPFKFVSYKPDDSVVLERNDQYWITPNLDGITFKIIPDDSVAMVALENGEIDLYTGPVPVSDAERMSSDTNFTLTRQTCPIMNQIMFNMNNDLYKEEKFRQAISYAIDGDAINATIYGVSAVSGAGTAGPGVPGYVEDLREKYYDYDPDKALALLKELGIEDTNGDGLLDKDGETLEIPFEVYNYSSVPRFGEAIVSQLSAIGLKVNMETVEMGKFIEDWSAGLDKMMFMSGWCGEGGLNSLWGSTGFAAPMGYSDEEVGKLLDEANITSDPEARTALLEEATDKIYSQYYAVSLGFYMPFEASRSYVKDNPVASWFFNVVTEKNNLWLDK